MSAREILSTSVVPVSIPDAEADMKKIPQKTMQKDEEEDAITEIASEKEKHEHSSINWVG